MIAITDATSNKTVMAFKLANVLVARDLFTSDGTAGASGGLETLSLWYTQIGIAVLTGTNMATVGWNLASNSSWAIPAGSFTPDATWGIKVA